MSKRSILFISPFSSPNIGGIETHISLLSDYLTKNGYKITLLTYQPLTTEAKVQESSNDNLKVYRFRWIGRYLFSTLENLHPFFNFIYLVPYLLIRSFLYMCIHHKEVNIIHVFGLNAAFVGYIMKCFFHKPLIVTLKGILGLSSRTLAGKVVQHILNNSDAILAGSLDSKDDIINMNIDSKKITVFTYWIDNKIFKLTNKQEKANGQQPFTIIYIGRLIKPKGTYLFLKTAQELPHIHFKIIGDGILKDYITSFVNSNKNIEFLGHLDAVEIARHLTSSNLFLYPIMYDEDVSLAILESLSTGTPVISSYQGSGIYRLNDDIAFITDPEVEQIKKIINNLYNNPEKLTRMSSNSRKFSYQFSSKLAKTITDIYEVILSKQN